MGASLGQGVVVARRAAGAGRQVLTLLRTAEAAARGRAAASLGAAFLAAAAVSAVAVASLVAAARAAATRAAICW